MRFDDLIIKLEELADNEVPRDTEVATESSYSGVSEFVAVTEVEYDGERLILR